MNQKSKKKAMKMPKPDYRWIVLIFGITLLISGLMSFVSSELLEGAGLVLSLLILVGIILLGILFDIIGVAVTSADETPFHSMASKKVPEAVEALKLIRNADRVSSFCNDVIGDICGVISGSAAAVIAARALGGNSDNPVAELILSALVAALTVGGKAFGKGFAIHLSTPIVQITARVLTFVKSIFKRRNKKGA